LAMRSEIHDVDPCPEIPAVFIDPLAALKLAQEVGPGLVRNLVSGAEEGRTTQTLHPLSLTEIDVWTRL
jgi:hypothetical protein